MYQVVEVQAHIQLWDWGGHIPTKWRPHAPEYYISCSVSLAAPTFSLPHAQYSGFTLVEVCSAGTTKLKVTC